MPSEPGTDATDAEIIGLSGREPERFAGTFDRYYTEIHGYVARRLGAGLADDVVAETFLIAFDRRARYDAAYPSARPPAAEGRPFTAPRPDQWIHIENKNTSPSEGPGGVATGGELKTRVERQWRQADGARSAWIEKGRLRIQTEPGVLTPPSDYPTLAALPTDPDALLQWAYKEMGGLGGDTEEGRSSVAFTLFNTILRDSLLPSRVEAAIYRAMKSIPGVVLVGDTVDVAGRPAVGIGRVQEGWLRVEVLLDRQTYGYLGERSVAIKDHTSKGLDGSFRVKRGTVQIYVVRVAAGVVDEPGQRPS
jgi:hypothetical protein